VPASNPDVTAFPIARRNTRFSYAIRNIVVEAQRVEAAGTRVRYLNIGDPVAFGFNTPRHLIEAVEKAMRDGHNGYGPSPGIPAGRAAVAAEYSARGFPVSKERAFLTAGTSEGIEFALGALAEEGSDVLLPMPTYPLYSAVLSRIGARAAYYRTDPKNGWLPDLDHLRHVVTSNTRALVVIDPNNPTGASYPEAVRRELLDFAARHNLPIVADEVYGDVAHAGVVPPLGSLDPDAPIISFSSLSKAYLAPGWRAGWMGIGRSPRLDDVVKAVARMADARLCSTLPMQYAVEPALTGDRSHQASFRAALAERARITTECLNAIPGVSCVRPTAAFYAMPRIELPPGKTDEDYVIGLLRTTGVLTVYGSGFGTRPEDGYLRIVFLASPDELRDIYRLMGDFTRDFLKP